MVQEWVSIHHAALQRMWETQEFEKLPLVEHVEILRNIIYSGMWTQYELKLNKNNKKKDSSNEKSL